MDHAPSQPRNFPLGISPYTYADLFVPERLKALCDTFHQELARADPDLAGSFQAYHAGAAFDANGESELLIGVAQHLGPFVGRLFHGEEGLRHLQSGTARHQLVFAFKRDFIGKRVRKRKDAGAFSGSHAAAYEALEAKLGGDASSNDPELRAACTAMHLLGLYQVIDRRPAAPLEELTAAEAEVASIAGHPVSDAKATLQDLLALVESWHTANMARGVSWPSYRTPHPIDPTHANLVQLRRPRAALQEVIEGPQELMRARDGFGLTDKRMTAREIAGEVDYCLYCHNREKDSCRHGLRDKQGTVKADPKGIPLDGCPLDERISEAHLLRSRGEVVGALAMVVVDNPMCPGTGHRICNDCMKACIFQKQEPVNIPQIETSILTDVLHLPFGFEIYSLLTRFNPLNRRRPYPLPYHGHNVLVTGLGPAGYTLSHYLINEGFGVVGIDGLKIEPLPQDMTGGDVWPPRAIKHYNEIEDALDERILRGFGGVAEYGITVRWDKNFLKVIYLTLARRQSFRFYGGIRFGGTLTVDDAWDLGFHHIAIAAGAGRPTVVNMKNNLLRGMRAASDFLMGLQLTGAFKRDSMANLQVELPAVVIGGGLTAVDTATELAAYYPVQVEKILARVEAVGEATVMAAYDAEEQEILQRMLAHGRALRAERQKPQPNLPALVRQWGGVAVAYRRGLADSPAYRLNHEEVQKALEEGIQFVENVTPLEAVPDAYGHVSALRCRRKNGEEVTLPARSVMVAAGTSPNVIYERELPGTFELDDAKRFFKSHRLAWDGSTPRLEPVATSGEAGGFFTSYQAKDRRFVSYYGDNHPRYAGNVVKAMASAKHGYPHVAQIFANQPPKGDMASFKQLVDNLDAQWLATVHAVNRLTPTIVEVVVRAPMQARKFAPGQFYRLQNFEALSPKVGPVKLTMEGLALTGAWVDKDQGLLSMIALEMGVSSRLCAMLKPGEPVVVMGPTGTPTEIPRGENVMLCGGGLGNAVLFSVAKAMRASGNRVIYFAGYRSAADLYRREEIESSADQVIWSVDRGAAIAVHRSEDVAFQGNIVQAMQAYAEGSIGPPSVPFDQIDRIIAIGSDRMMAAVTRARKTTLAAHLRPDHTAIASINSPMQCMMKEVCAQCLQRHVDPHTGEESFVFSCFNQDQQQDNMDWQHLAARLRQNTVVEKLGNLWFDRMLAQQQG